MNDRSRPAKAAPEVIAATDTSIAPSWDKHPQIASQVRARRAASRRMTALDDGRRDPIDKRRARTITVRVLGGRTVEFIGAYKAIVDACEDVGARYMRNPHDRTSWLVRGDLADDVEALLSARGYAVQGAL